MAVVAKTGDIPEGALKRFEIDGQSIGLTRSGGKFYAFDTKCTHEECDLVDEGEVYDSELTCLCHFSVFDLGTGDVLDGPAPKSLRMYEVVVQDDDLDVRV